MVGQAETVEADDKLEAERGLEIGAIAFHQFGELDLRVVEAFETALALLQVGVVLPQEEAVWPCSAAAG